MSGEINSIAIVGGYGKMGRWFARRLMDEGFQVVIAGRDRAKLEQAARELGCACASNEEAVRQADAVILSVPVNSFEAIAREISPYVKPGQYVFDITSVKAGPVEAMHRHLGICRVLGTHPMFGPGADGVEGQHFVLTPIREEDEQLAAAIRQHLEKRGAKVAVMSPAEHDGMMSIVLGLPHFIALAAADTLLSLGNLSEASAVSGTTYRLLLTMAEAVVSEDADFYSSLQMGLPGMSGIEEIFIAKAESWLELVRHADADNFARRMNYLKSRFKAEEPGFADSYRRAYRVLADENRHCSG